MSRNSDTSSTHLEEEEEAFLDLEDPNNQILDDGENDDNNEEPLDEDDDNDAQDGDTGDAAAEPAVPPIDLNEVPDIEPERDDSVASFSAPDAKPLHCVCVSPRDASIVAVGGEGDEVYIISISTEQGPTVSSVSVKATLRGHTDTITRVAFSPNGELLASGSMDMTIRIWDANTWELLHTFSDLSGEIETLLWHPSSLALVAGAADAQAALWNVKKGTLAMYFVGHRQNVLCSLWSTDNKKLITGSSDGSIIVFNPKTGEHEANVNKDLSPDLAGVTAMQCLSDDIVIVGCDDGTIHLVSISKGKAVAHLEDTHSQSIESIDVSANGALYVTSSCDGKLVVWNAQDHSRRVVFDVGEGVIPARWVNNMIIAGYSDGALRVWDGRSVSQEPVLTWKGHRRMILGIAVDAQNGRCVTACDDGTLKVFALQKQQQA